MTLRSGPVAPVGDHGGSLERARRRFPKAVEPWIDLSTGINPHAYPQLDLSAEILTRLPEPGREKELRTLAARAYGAPQADNVVATPGTQIALPRVMALLSPGKCARVLAPTYAEHIRAARIAGHEAVYVDTFEQLFGADLAILVNPNNPDGRIVERPRLLELARHMQAKGGLLVIDEAFMDVGPLAGTLAPDVEACGAIVLRSFGKFFGLAGLRLGFILAPCEIASCLRDEFGPWAVSGPALEYGIAGLFDETWQKQMRSRLDKEIRQLDAILEHSGLRLAGGTSLFRLVRSPNAGRVFNMLCQAGILVRRFDDIPDALRFGLPAEKGQWHRLKEALAYLDAEHVGDRIAAE